MRRRWERLLKLLLQPWPVTFDLLLDAGVVHDPGGIKGVAEEIAPLIPLPAEPFSSIALWTPSTLDPNLALA